MSERVYIWMFDGLLITYSIVTELPLYKNPSAFDINSVFNDVSGLRCYF